jgi:DNA-binding NtrC family response regulator
LRTVWILDASEAAAEELVRALPSLIYSVRVWTDPEETLEALAEAPPDLLVVEHGIGRAATVDVLRRAKRKARRLPVIVVAERTSSQGAIESMREGAYDYLPRETLPAGLEDAARRALSGEGGIIRTIGSPGPADVADLGAIVGRTPEMVEVHKLIGQIAATDACVLIHGEPGTGKELVARAIHYNSTRRDRPFVAVSCSATPPASLEAELFGTAGGEPDRVLGRVELAHAGTVFLDDIDEASLEVQGRILSALENGWFEIPRTRTRVKADVRVIGATGRSLVSRMKEGRFRVDLFYRLKIVSIFIPPLRERLDDIPYLAEHFLARARTSMRRDIEGMSPGALRLLRSHSWPGNIRELEQAVQRAAALCRTSVLGAEDFGSLPQDAEEWPAPEGPAGGSLESCVRAEYRRLRAAGETAVDAAVTGAVERALAEAALGEGDGNQVKAAGLLGISRNTLRKRLDGRREGRAPEDRRPTRRPSGGRAPGRRGR